MARMLAARISHLARMCGATGGNASPRVCVLYLNLFIEIGRGTINVNLFLGKNNGRLCNILHLP